MTRALSGDNALPSSLWQDTDTAKFPRGSPFRKLTHRCSTPQGIARPKSVRRPSMATLDCPAAAP
jgi:hypothetical protein